MGKRAHHVKKLTTDYTECALRRRSPPKTAQGRFGFKTQGFCCCCFGLRAQTSLFLDCWDLSTCGYPRACRRDAPFLLQSSPYFLPGAGTPSPRNLLHKVEQDPKAGQNFFVLPPDQELRFHDFASLANWLRQRCMIGLCQSRLASAAWMNSCATSASERDLRRL